MNAVATNGVVPLPSATVVLAREAPSAPEILLVQRHADTSFGATHVFPGGLLESCDRVSHGHCIGQRAARADTCLGVDSGALDYYSAAVRELFEETGVLLARGPGGDWAWTASCGRAEEFAALRRELNAGGLSWPSILRDYRLQIDCDALHYFAHWITPVRRPKRFTTRFFAAVLPGDQCATHDGGELTDSCWMTAQQALDADRSGRIALPPPTRATLHELTAMTDAGELLRWAARREADGVQSVLPAIVSDTGCERIVMPGSPDYPADTPEPGSEANR